MSRPLPTLRGWVVGACGVVLLVAAGWFGRVDLLFAGLLLTLAPLAALIALTFDRPWLDVSRTYAPDAVAAGDEVQVRLGVRNVSPRPTPAMTWVDTLPAGFAPTAARSLPSLVARADTGVARGADTVTLRYTARPQRRGTYLLGPLLVTRTDPFGLARGGYGVGESKVLVVTPRVSALGPGVAEVSRGEGTDPELVRHSIPSSDEVTPREYRPGDPLRRVQWRATARLDRLMVRQEEQLSNPEAWLLLDTVRARPGDGEAFERAVELAASVAVHLLELGYLVGVHETGERRLAGSYQLPGGDHLLVGELAALAQSTEPGGDVVGRFAAGLRGARAAVPTFLILAGGEPGFGGELAALRRYASPAIAFLMTPAASAARESLERAGWVCVQGDEGRDAAAVWSLAAQAHQRATAQRFAEVGDV
ncbi:DUF58 domain-containing protein [Gryllotalpicola daejeonensis]|uniref:DUF58 domain-containing protein n=1 Tax=Gryllotalpicola daejeonensis TaxID=993087 RepID=UPI0031DFE5E4